MLVKHHGVLHQSIDTENLETTCGLRLHDLHFAEAGCLTGAVRSCDTRTGSSRPDQPCDRVIQVWLLKELMKYGLHGNVLRRERRLATRPGRDLPGLRDRTIDLNKLTRPPFACAEPATAVP